MTNLLIQGLIEKGNHYKGFLPLSQYMEIPFIAEELNESNLQINITVEDDKIFFKVREFRTCEICKKVMHEGYVIESLGETFCTEKCIDSRYPNTSQELSEMTDEELEESETYWTQWE